MPVRHLDHIPDDSPLFRHGKALIMFVPKQRDSSKKPSENKPETRANLILRAIAAIRRWIKIFNLSPEARRLYELGIRAEDPEAMLAKRNRRANSKPAVYKVLVDDNFHLLDSLRRESEQYELGEFESLEDAISACKKLVDDFLLSDYKPGMTAAELDESYKVGGPDPWIRDSSFSAWDYAKERSEEICRK